MLFLLIKILIFIPFLALSEDNIYLIKDIKVVIDNENIMKARDRAKKVAFEKGFNTLLKRIVSEENFGQINTLTEVDVVKFIKEFKIKKENTRDSVYVASIDVNFNKEKIDKYLKINNLKVSNIISERFLILAVHKRLNNLYLWEKSNNWNKALKNEYDKENLLNLFFPSQNYLNKFKISPKETLSENKERLSNILRFFNKRSGLIIYLDETYNTKNENITSNVELKEFTFNYVNEIKINDQKLKNNISKGSQIDLLAKFTMQELNNWWKKRTVVSEYDNSKKKSFYIYSSFSELSESLKIEEIFINSAFVNSFLPVTISSERIIYELKSNENIEKINISLRPFGYKLIQNSGESSFFISKIF